MKNILFIVFLIILSIINAQNNVPDQSNFVQLKGGEKIQFIRISKAGKDYLTIRTPNNEKKKIPSEKIDKIIWPRTLDYHNGKVRSFDLNTWKYIKVKTKLVFVAELEIGYCSAYVNPKDDSYNFYVKRANEESATIVHNPKGVGKKLKKAGKKYFSDCPKIVEMIKESRIQNKFHQVYEKLIEFVSFYNENCAKIETK